MEETILPRELNQSEIIKGSHVQPNPSNVTSTWTVTSKKAKYSNSTTLELSRYYAYKTQTEEAKTVQRDLDQNCLLDIKMKLYGKEFLVGFELFASMDFSQLDDSNELK